MLNKEHFLPTITTTRGSDWKSKVKEIDKLGLKRIAIFPTCLERQQREELYRLLEKTKLKGIPFVHIRTDMKIEELDYLVQKWGTRVFNVHTKNLHPLVHNYSKYKQIMYIENHPLLEEKELKDFAGLCIDFTHLEDVRRLYKDIFKKTIIMIKKHPIGCNHISAIPETPHPWPDGRQYYSLHHFEHLSEFDYLKKYPKAYFSKFIAIELENSLAEQLQVIDYIVNLFLA